MGALRRILICPTAFKGSMDPVQVAEAIERGVRTVLPRAETMLVPLADGGDGMLKCIQRAGACVLHTHCVHDSLMRKHSAPYGLHSDSKTVFIEMAQISGLAQLHPSERDPRVTTTFGVGEMIAHAIQLGAGRLVIGLGGSSTNDGGSGALRALGWQLQDRHGEKLPHGGAALAKLYTLIPSVCSDHELQVVLAVDVRNPLLGKQGASAVFAPQKGATPDMLPTLEAAMRRWALMVHRTLGRKLSHRSGAGAAGGLAFGLMAHFPQAQTVSGAEFVMQVTGFHGALRKADLVLTGEGQIDVTTQHGKLLARVLRAAKRERVPVALVCGIFQGDSAALTRQGMLDYETLVSNGVSREEAMLSAPALVEHITAKLMEKLQSLFIS